MVQHGGAVLPIDGLEAQLVKIWERVLNIKPIGTTDNFMELGGTSLLAVRLADQIDRRLNQSVPLSVIFKAPTIKQLAQILRQGNVANLNFSLVEIQPQGSKPPLFLFEGASIYYPLIPYVGLDQPIYGLIALLKDGVNGPVNQVEAIAAHYVNEMIKVQPNGPYYLGGLSFGGIVAFEVAQQLAANGQETALLILFDAMLPSAYKPISLDQRLQFHTKKVIKNGVRHISDRIISRTTAFVNTLNLRIRYQKVEKSNQVASHTTEYWGIGEEIDQAERVYTPKPYRGQVVMFRALDEQENESASVDPDLGWKPYLKDGMAIYDVPGDHLGILKEPNVGVLGNHLKHLLDEAHQGN
jgi:aspartate racemase